MSSIHSNLVIPAYFCFKAAEILQIFPISLNFQSGKFSRKSSVTSKVFHFLLFLLVCTKDLHLVYEIFFVELLSDGVTDSASLIFTIILTSIYLTGTFWNYELFHKGVGETIILFNSLEFLPSSEIVIPIMEYTSERSKCKKWRIKRCFSSQRSRRTVARLKLILKEASHLQTRQDILTVISPFIMNVFAPLITILLLLFPDWDTFLTGSFSRVYGSNWISMGGICVEILVVQFVTSTILFLFWFELSLQSAFISRWSSELRKVNRFERCVT